MFVLEQHQAEAVSKGIHILRRNRILFLKMWMRKGKTLTSLSICQECLQHTPDPHVLFITEKQPIASVVDDFKLFDNACFSLFVINYESVHKAPVRKWNIIIIDEAHKLGAYPKPAKWTQKIKAIAHNTPIIYLSATLTPETFSQIYHILWVSSYTPFAQWSNFYLWARKFVNVTEKMIKGYPKKDYDDCKMQELVWPMVKHLFVTVAEDQGTQTSELVEKILKVDMQPRTIEIYKQLKQHKIYVTEQGKAAISNSGAELNNKLAQVCSGTLIFGETVSEKLNEEGDILDCTKAEFIRSYFFGRKIAILFRFKAEERMLKMFFPNWTDDYMLFNNRNDLTYIKQVRSASMGIKLHTADAIVMFNIMDSAVVFIQALARGQSMFRTEPSLVYWVFSQTGFEESIYNKINTEKKQVTQFYYDQARV